MRGPAPGRSARVIPILRASRGQHCPDITSATIAGPAHLDRHAQNPARPARRLPRKLRNPDPGLLHRPALRRARSRPLRQTRRAFGRHVLSRGRAAGSRAPLRRVPRLLRRALPAQARRLGGRRARRQHRDRLRRRPPRRGPHDPALPRRAPALRVAEEGLLPRAERARADTRGQPRGERALPQPRPQARPSAARRRGAAQAIRFLARPEAVLPAHRRVRVLREPVPAGGNAVRPARARPARVRDASRAGSRRARPTRVPRRCPRT